MQPKRGKKNYHPSSGASRTTPNRSTRFTPFFLVYGAEAVMPSDIEHDAPRFVLFTEAEAKQAYEDGMDLLEEERQLAESRSAMY